MENDLGKKIRRLREERGWSQPELSKRSHVDRSTIALIELGKIKNPSTSKLINLAQAFDIHQNELFVAAGYIKEPRAGYNHDPSPEQLLDEIQLAVRRLSPVDNLMKKTP